MRRLWINGQTCEGGAGVQPVINPATEEHIGQAAWGNQGDAERAVVAASAAFRDWRRVPVPERTAMLHEAARRLRANLEELATELTLETGRTLRKNRGYVEWSAQCFDYYAELIRNERGRVIGSPENGQLSLVLKVPLGVVAAIVPWNYPLLLLAWKLAPALAAGTTVVIKPASYTPWTTLGLTRVLDHFPSGVVNIVSGPGGEVGEHLVRHPEVRLIAFTGSTEVGQRIMRLAADEMKHIHLELGGKDPLLVCADANLDAAARAAVWGGFLNAGQVCTSVERVYVERLAYEPFLERAVELTKGLVIGHGLDPESEVTPMIRAKERDAVAGVVEAARAAGATVLAGGRRPP
ncbi:MAG: aldehyde dehydrogenase family protein, partial [Candidatus Promineifilaceae bacterium]|nr:aldehyde dehydrogenase family protein [Candidatus Promineifilaceae bacterium]